jgi:hypothetical protein
MRPVTLGQTNQGEAIVATGLAAGEQVVREGQFLLGPGSRIEIKGAEKVSAETGSELKRSRAKADRAETEALKASETTKAKGGRARRGEGQTKRGAAGVDADKNG